MWGFAAKRNRQLSLKLFKIITNKIISAYYNKVKDQKGLDQILLTDFFSKYSIKNSTTHDSYNCYKHNDASKPWPSKRVGKCFVGGNRTKCIESESFEHICPIRCRPSNHLDWIFC